MDAVARTASRVLKARKSRPKFGRVQNQPTAQVYTALLDLRQGFDQVFLAMIRLNDSGIAKGDLFEGCRELTTEAAAWACHQVAEALRDRELNNWTLAANAWEAWQKRLDEQAFPGSKRKNAGAKSLTKPLITKSKITSESKRWRS
jgi:hypothetical protein